MPLKWNRNSEFYHDMYMGNKRTCPFSFIISKQLTNSRDNYEKNLNFFTSTYAVVYTKFVGVGLQL